MAATASKKRNTTKKKAPSPTRRKVDTAVVDGELQHFANGRRVVSMIEAAKIIDPDNPPHQNTMTNRKKAGHFTNLLPEFGTHKIYLDEALASASGTDSAGDDSPGKQLESAKYRQTVAQMAKARRKHNTLVANLIPAFDVANALNEVYAAAEASLRAWQPEFIDGLSEDGVEQLQDDIEAALLDARTKISELVSQDLDEPPDAQRKLLELSEEPAPGEELPPTMLQAALANLKADTIFAEDGENGGEFVDLPAIRRAANGLAAVMRDQLNNFTPRLRNLTSDKHRHLLAPGVTDQQAAIAKAVRAQRGDGDGPREQIIDAFIKGIEPLPPMTGAEWQNKHRRLDASVSARPGKMKIETTSYFKEVLNAACKEDPLVEQVTIVAGAQMSKSETLVMSTVGYWMDRLPCPIIIGFPSDDTARMFAQTRFPQIFETPVIAEKLDEVKEDARRSARADAAQMRSYAGGTVSILSMASKNNLASRPGRLILMDEIDRTPNSSEGNSIELLRTRATTYGESSMIVVTSTPTELETSKVWQEFLKGTQEYYYTPCPDCGEAHILSFDQIHMVDDNPETARYQCPSCGSLWDDLQRLAAVKAGRWIAHNPQVKRHRSFQISSLYSPFLTLEKITLKKIAAEQGGIEDRITFRNVTEGLPWTSDDNESTAEVITQRIRDDAHLGIGLDAIPADCLLITAGIDLQADRAEVQFLGWSEDGRCFALGTEIYFGDPSGGALWADVDEALGRTWPHPYGGRIGIARTCVDSGYETQRVMQFCTRRASYFAIKGSSNFDAPIWRVSKAKVKPGEAKLHLVGVSQLKLQLFRSMLKAPKDAENHISFANMESHSPHGLEGYATQLCSEFLEAKWSKGQAKQSWERRGRADREALDTFIYAIASRRSMPVVDFEARREALTVHPSDPDDTDDDGWVTF